MKKIYIIIALSLIAVGCARIKTTTSVSEDSEITIENNSNMELAIINDGSMLFVPSNMVATVSLDKEFNCKNSRCEIKVPINTKTIIVNQDGEIKTK